MSVVAVEECDTAEAVRLRAAKVRAWRQRGWARVPPLVPSPPIMSLVEQAPPPRTTTICGASLKPPHVIIAEFTRQVLRLNNSTPLNTVPKINKIVQIVAVHFGVSVLDILSDRRHRNITLPRQIAMYLARKTTMRSMPDIGRKMGGRDHTTVLHGTRKIAALMLTDAELCHDVIWMEQQLLEGRA